MLVQLKILITHSMCDKAKRIHKSSSFSGNFRMFWPCFIDLQNFILLVCTVLFFRKVIFNSSYTEKNNYFYCTNYTVYRRKGAYPFKTAFPEPYQLKTSLATNNDMKS